MFNRRRWLARFAFSFWIFAAVLAWDVYQIHVGRRGPVPAWRLPVELVAACLAVPLGVAGIRARHEADDRGDQR